MTSSNKSRGRLLVGILFIAFGALYILDNFDILNFNMPFRFFSWGGILITIGIVILLAAKNKIPGFVFIMLGVFFTYSQLWPLVLVFLGGYLIFGKFRSKLTGTDSDKTESNNKIDDMAVFGGGKKNYFINNFAGGRSTAIFGGSEIDLSSCNLVDGESHLEIIAIFGGATFVMPKDWNLEIDVISIFGGFADRRRKDPNLVPSPEKILKIKGVVIFGGGEIKG